MQFELIYLKCYHVPLFLLYFRILSVLYMSSFTKRKMQFTLLYASSSAAAAWPLLSVFSCYSPVPNFPAQPSSTIQFSHTILLEHVLCVLQYILYSYLYTQRQHSAPSML